MLLSATSAKNCWMLDLDRPIRDRRRSVGHLAVCGRSGDMNFVVNGMLRQIAGRSVRYAGELVVLVMQFFDICHFRTVIDNHNRQILRR